MRLPRTVLVTMLLLASLTVLMAISGNSHANQSPIASFTYSPPNPGPEQTILFNASTSFDPDGWILQYRWNFGDGNISALTSPIVTHAYPVDGNYTVELTVTDNSGSTGVSAAVVEVSTEVFFRVVYYGTLVPMQDVEVTVYYNDGSAWVKAPTGPHGLEIKYDNDTQTYRNPGFTASALKHNASNIGFDIHPAYWTVYFKFKWGNYVAYWPNETTRVYTYQKGVVETHDYLPGHRAYWDSAASTYVIGANDIPGNGVSPTSSHPIIVGLLCPPPQKYCLTVRTSPAGVTPIPGEGFYIKDTNVTLTAPQYVDISGTSRYRFTYWDVNGTSRGNDVNPITVCMNANYAATAHYVMQYSVLFNQTGLGSDATGTVATVNGSVKTRADLAYTLWVDSGSFVTYMYNSSVSSSVSGKRYSLSGVSGPTSPITVVGASTVTGNYAAQYNITFASAGLDATSEGTVVTINGTPKTRSDLPFTTWANCGDTITYSYSTTVASSTTGKRFRLTSVSGTSSPFTVSQATTVTGNYVTQFTVTFTHTGLDANATGTVVTANGEAKYFADLPFVDWIDSGSSVTYLFNDVVLSNVTGKRYRLLSVSGPTSPTTVSGPVAVTGSYKSQFELTFDQSGTGGDFTGTVATIDGVPYVVSNMPTSTTFWWDKNSSHTFSFASPLNVNASMQYVWSSTSGLSNLQSGTLTVTVSGGVVANYIAQNCVIFDQVGVGPDFTGTVLIVDGVPYSVGSLPIPFYWQLGTSHTFAFQSPLIVSANVKQYVWTSTTGLSAAQSGAISVTTFGGITGHYGTQHYLNLPAIPPGITSPSGSGWYDANTYASISTAQYVYGGSRWRFASWITTDMNEITNPLSPSTTVLVDKGKIVYATYTHQYDVNFSQTGVGDDFTGTIVTVDETEYTYGTLPKTFWWDEGSSHTFAFSSPLVVNVSRQYVWTTTSGLTTLQSGTLNATASGNVIGNYATQIKYQITFDETGVGTDFAGTVITIDGTNYTAAQLPASFWWDNNSAHTFACQSPLVVLANSKQYVWTGTNGLSSLQSGPITVTGSGSVVGNYKTQFYLTTATNPPGVTSPTGSEWYDAGSNATVSTNAFVDIIPGSSRYRFNGWTTTNMTEIADPTKSPTQVLMDEAKTVTANYVVQYAVTFNQTGINSDFIDTVLTVDGRDYNLTVLPVTFWWDNDSLHNFAFQSPLVVTSNSKQYAWANTSGLASLQSGSITVTTFGNVIGNYKTQFYLTLTIHPLPGGTTNPEPGVYLYTAASNVSVTAVPNANYAFDQWELDGVNVSSANPYTVIMNSYHVLKAWFRALPPSQITLSITPLDKTISRNESVLFTSDLSGGTPPYTYQWYLNEQPVAGANSGSWTFMPGSSGTYFVHLKVTDSEGNSTQSNVARIRVQSIPTGGYSISLARETPMYLVATYIALVALLGAMIMRVRRKRQ